jgi:mRNA-degrading endonuclease RelE of RelBE toxin-antitoxin system
VPYTIEFADAAIEHLRSLTAGERATIVDAIDEQLSYEPLLETRNRKPLRPNPIATWELRVGLLRAFYDITSPEPLSAQTSGVVRIMAIGKKVRNVLWIGGEEIDL